MDKAFDVIVAGGGLTGVLAAARLAAAHPRLRILLIEREPALGGRLRCTAPDRSTYSYGLNAVSTALYDFVDQTLRSDPDAPELAALAPGRQTQIGVLAGNKITHVDIGQWFSAKGARLLGGFAASRQWAEVEEILAPSPVKPPVAAPEPDDGSAAGYDAAAHGDAEEDEDGTESGDDEAADPAGRAHPFAHYWKKTRKAPAAIVLEHFASAIGIPDLWSAAPQAIVERAAFHASGLRGGSWELALLALTELPAFAAGVTVKTSSMIVGAGFEADEWLVATESGEYRGRALVVAQPPWQAVTWLKRALWPAHVLQIPSKTKPVSVVVLAERVPPAMATAAAAIPDVLIVPSERVQIVRNGSEEISFQATIDFELSLSAPAVVKAVRSLKRARKKLVTLHPGLVSEGNHIALQTVAWAQSPSHTDRRWIERLQKKPFNTKTLAFCGDAYGGHYDGDSNILRSLVAACDAVGALGPARTVTGARAADAAVQTGEHPDAVLGEGPQDDAHDARSDASTEFARDDVPLA